MGVAYYNENDPRAAAWLRELITHGFIASGIVDERSIEDVAPNELSGFTQCHFFAGIGGWSYALHFAGWPDGRPVWTGSCPCQPFSTAGKGKGTADERHLWPAWEWLIQQCRPSVIFGEQVASPAGLSWFDLVSTDLEGSGYTVAAADLCAAGVGAPHIRQRLYWVAHTNQPRLQRWHQPRNRIEQWAIRPDSMADRLGNTSSTGSGGYSRSILTAKSSPERKMWDESNESIPTGKLGNADRERQQQHAQRDGESVAETVAPRGTNVGGPGPWGDADWVRCRDGKSRPVESGTFPLAHGIPGRVGLLRGYGNAIVPQVAAVFIEATGLV